MTEEEQEKAAQFLQERGYEGVVPLYTALLIESITTRPERGKSAKVV